MRKSLPSLGFPHSIAYNWSDISGTLLITEFRLHWEKKKQHNLESVAAVSTPRKGFDTEHYTSSASSQGFNLHPVTHPLARRDLVSVHKIRSIFRRQSTVCKCQILLVLHTRFVKPSVHNLVSHMLNKGDLGLNSNSFIALTCCFNPSALLHRRATTSAAAANKQDQ